MTDVFDKAKRSLVMSKIRSKGNKSTELRLIDIFAERGVKGWRRNYDVRGHPDFIFPERKIAVFVDGCFWHGHDCRLSRPKQNAEFWAAKLERNMSRDKTVTREFERRGWTVVRIWECELRKKNLPELFARLDRLFPG
ncbi:MAG: very short patch repair endonuclease [Deltaproteobacteria bacterium]|jgi:DNA mismatch endonuclease (patch repair protein)|nr:very short patch repair endonuclease [Deltaproteobacteria bacterium]